MENTLSLCLIPPLFVSLLREHMKLAAQPLMSYCDSRHHGRRGKYSPAVSILEDGKRKCSESRLPSPSPSSSSSSLIWDILFQMSVLWDTGQLGCPWMGGKCDKIASIVIIMNENIPAQRRDRESIRGADGSLLCTPMNAADAKILGLLGNNLVSQTSNRVGRRWHCKHHRAKSENVATGCWV